MDFFDETEMSVKDWIITMVITLIPVVGIIFLVLWAYSDAPYRRARKTWAIAMLILMGAAIVIYIIVAIVIIGVMGFKF